MSPTPKRHWITARRLAAAATLAVAASAPCLAQANWFNETPFSAINEPSDDIWSLTYANGTFVATTAQGYVLTSTDGNGWGGSAVSPGTWLVSAAYGNGLWVVVGANGTILYSPDLQNWTRATAATGNKLNGVFFSSLGPTAGNFVAVGDNGTVLTSPDAMNWTVQPSGVAGFLHGIIAGWGAVLVTGQGGVLLRGAINGTSFEALASGTSQDLEAVASNSQMAVAVGANGTVIYHRFLAESLAEMADPFDGWTQAAPVTSARLRGLAYGNGTFVATGEQGTILTSGDGINWSRRFAGIKVGSLSTANLLGAAFGPVQGRFVAVGTGNAGLFSALTQTIFANVSTRGNVSGSQTLIGGFVVAGTDPRRVLLRADGPVLAGFNVPNPLPDPVITVYDSKQNVVATNAGWTTNASPSAVSAAAQKVGAFTLPSSSKDSAVLLTLQPGAYTAVITTASGNSGTALFESYIY